MSSKMQWVRTLTWSLAVTLGAESVQSSEPVAPDLDWLEEIVAERSFGAEPMVLAQRSKSKRYGIEGRLGAYDADKQTLQVKVSRTKVSGNFGTGGIAGGKPPKSIRRGQQINFRVVPEGSVLRRTVFKSIQGEGLDNTGTQEGFQKALAMVPEDRDVVLSFEKNDEPDAGNNGVPEWRLKMVQIRLTQEEIDARLDSMTVEDE